MNVKSFVFVSLYINIFLFIGKIWKYFIFYIINHSVYRFDIKIISQCINFLGSLTPI